MRAAFLQGFTFTPLHRPHLTSPSGRGTSLFFDRFFAKNNKRCKLFPMYRDIAEIRQFYRSALGRLVAQVLNRKLKSFWADPMAKDKNIVGVGFPMPYLEHCQHNKNFAVMAASAGVVRWPSSGPCRTVLTADHVLPFGDASIEKILLIHAVENADYLRELMHEVWRVLAPNGRVLLVVPNRSGFWAKSDKTPFGYGRPYSMKQLRGLLFDLQFVIDNHKRALYFPPLHNRFMLAIAPLLEILGEMLMPKFGGVTIVEASKRLYNVTPLKVSPVATPQPIPAWASEPVPT